MKRILVSLIAASVAGLIFSASAQPAPGGDNTNSVAPEPASPPPDMGNGPDAGAPPPPPPEANNNNDNSASDEDSTTSTNGALVITPSQKESAAPEEIQSPFMPPTQAGTNMNDLNLNFSHARLDMVLNYLSDAAGFVVVQDTRVNGYITVKGQHLTRDEAVDLLNSELNKNGLAAIRDGRTLTIVDKNDAKTREIPVKSGNNPADIPKNAEIVTYIIPVRFVEARQLASDLSSFVSPEATVVANEAGNSIVITDTQANIHHLTEIIKAVDDSAEAETEIRVFHLAHANPTDVANELTSVFPSSSSSGSSAQSPIRFGGGFPGGGGGSFLRAMMAGQGGGGGGGSSSGGSNDRIKKATQVNAVADLRISAVIVTAPKDLIEQIASMMKDLDVASDRDQEVYTYKLNNADPLQAAQVLQSMFQSTTSRSGSGSGSSSSSSSALQSRAQNNNSTTGSSSSGGGSGFGTMGGGNSRGGGAAF